MTSWNLNNTWLFNLKEPKYHNEPALLNKLTFQVISYFIKIARHSPYQVSNFTFIEVSYLKFRGLENTSSLRETNDISPALLQRPIAMTQISFRMKHK